MLYHQIQQVIMPNIKRLTKELADLKNSQCSEILTITQVNLTCWNIDILGPQNSPYHGISYKLEITFPPTYPLNAPLIKFVTPIFHPNIDSKGNICLDILKTNWCPAVSMIKILTDIVSLVGNPNPEDPLRPEASELYKRDNYAFVQKVKAMAKNNLSQ